MKVTDVECVKGFIRMCSDGYALGWHERNGGNFTYRMKDDEVELCKENFNYGNDWVQMDVVAGNLKNEYFITTGSGKFMRNVELSPADNIGIVQLNDQGNAYKIVWGLNNGAKPTSEFPTHIMNHSIRKEKTNGKDRVIYHCHCTNVIALTFVVPLTDRDFSRVLWKTMTECPIVFPEGVGVVEWMVPGGKEIALKTCELMKKYQAVIWAHHGLFVTGTDFDTAFGLAHTIEKSAEIYQKILSTGKPILATINDEGLKDAARCYDVELNKDFVD